MRLTRFISALALLALAPAAFAQELSSETIQCQLNPDCGVPRAPASACPPGHPLDGVNRRVQIVNVSVPMTAAR